MSKFTPKEEVLKQIEITEKALKKWKNTFLDDGYIEHIWGAALGSLYQEIDRFKETLNKY